MSQKIAEIERNPESTKEEKRLVDLKEYLKELDKKPNIIFY